MHPNLSGSAREDLCDHDRGLWMGDHSGLHLGLHVDCGRLHVVVAAAVVAGAGLDVPPDFLVILQGCGWPEHCPKKARAEDSFYPPDITLPW